MLKQYHHLMGGAFRIFDATVIALSWIAAYYLRFEVLPVVEATKGTPPSASYMALAPLVVILWGSVFSAMHVYKSRRILRRTDEVRLILKSHWVSVVLFVALIFWAWSGKRRTTFERAARMPLEDDLDEGERR